MVVNRLARTKVVLLADYGEVRNLSGISFIAHPCTAVKLKCMYPRNLLDAFRTKTGNDLFLTSIGKTHRPHQAAPENPTDRSYVSIRRMRGDRP